MLSYQGITYMNVLIKSDFYVMTRGGSFTYGYVHRVEM